ncbi:uncharacterized protein [Magallana gigas]
MTMEGIVKVCPITEKMWKTRAKNVNCAGLNSYHCLSDNEDRKWERCIEKALIKEGNCPIFTRRGFIDWKPCNISLSTCPNTSYVSDDVYKYPGCFGNNSMHEESILDHKAEDTSKGLTIGIVLSVMFLLAAVLIIVIIKFRRKCFNQDAQEEPSELQRLIPDGVPEEIVEKKHVTDGFNKLLQEKARSIVVLGKIGNSVFSTSRLISETFTKNEKWQARECRYTDIPKTVEKNTIMYVYGWFGMWNDDLCSEKIVELACKSLIQILKETTNVKIIIGMRSDLYMKYHKELDEAGNSQNLNLFHHKIFLDSVDASKDVEYKIYFEENIKKVCEKNECACKGLTYEMLQEEKDILVGLPIKLNVIQRYHELIPYYLEKIDILKAMVEHFTSIEKETGVRHVYEWIMYICLKGKFSRSDQFDTHLVDKMGFKIEQSSFNENTELSRYVRMRNSDKLNNVSSRSVSAQFVFWHPFIYICAFHHLFQKDAEFLMKYCNVDAILQLVRPRGTKTSYFEVAANDRCVTIFKERISLLGIEKEYSNNPLVKIGTENAGNEQLIANSN